MQTQISQQPNELQFQAMQNNRYDTLRMSCMPTPFDVSLYGWKAAHTRLRTVSADRFVASPTLTVGQ